MRAPPPDRAENGRKDKKSPCQICTAHWHRSLELSIVFEGEVRRINLIEKRLKEAEKLGFKTCIIPENNKKSLKDEYKLDIIGVKNIGEALRKLGIK